METRLADRQNQAMRPLLENSHAHPGRRRTLRLFALGVVCAVLFPDQIRAVELADSKGDANDHNSGPTIKLNYTRETFAKNPISSFMYFVPLVSPTLVERQTSAGNNQEVGILSYARKIGKKSFRVECEFEIRGTGFHRNTFDPTGLIATATGELDENETLTRTADYINIEGEGHGRIVVKGTIDGTTQTVTEVDVNFRAGTQKSPLTIGLYDVVPVNGQYFYEDRSNESVARVNTLTFRKNDTNPTMRIGVASIKKAGAREGFLARAKGAIANLVITPPRIEQLGNETMLRLGQAVLNKDPEFTFPPAKNLKEEKTVEP